jgi:hypothetical protein
MLAGREQAIYAERDRKLLRCDIEQRSHRHGAAFDDLRSDSPESNSAT